MVNYSTGSTLLMKPKNFCLVSRWNRSGIFEMKKLISLHVSLIILAVIYWKIDLHSLIYVFKNCNGWWLIISLGMVVPLTLLTSRRLQQLIPHSARLGFAEANRLTLVASALNIMLPFKMGEITKAYFVKERTQLDGSFSLSLVVFEKACDMISLLLWCAFGLILYSKKDWFFWAMTGSVIFGLSIVFHLLSSRKLAHIFFVIGQYITPKQISSNLEKLQCSWNEMHDFFWSDKIQLFKVAGTSVFIWFLHLLQIWFFILTLKAWTPFLTNLALAPLAILVVLLPLTFASIGTPDAALIFLYHPFFNAPTAAALGLLCTTRYLLPAICGLPLLRKYIQMAHTSRKKPGKLWGLGTEL